jgi:hypothetical protein
MRVIVTHSVFVREAATPLARHARTQPSVNFSSELRIANSKKLRAVIENRVADASGREPAANAAPLVEHNDAYTAALQFTRGEASPRDLRRQ